MTISSTSFKAGKLHPFWKGNKAGYSALHKWVDRQKTKPLMCERCGKKRFLHWANISHKYLRKVTDWMALCVPCHRAHDGLAKIPLNRVSEIRERVEGGELQKTIAKEFGVNPSTISELINNKTRAYAN